MSRSRLQAALLVDGYNVIGASSVLSRVRDRLGLETSRQKLIEDLVSYSAFEGLATTIVFDAYLQSGPSSCQVITENLSVHYTEFGQTADTYIEKMCATFDGRNLYHSSLRLIVATSDRTQQMMVMGYGAEWISAQRLINKVEATAHQLKHQHQPKKPSSRRFLIDALDPTTQQRLAELRKSMKSD
jgi:predicted RNA-binding protein with PIN domain